MVAKSLLNVGLHVCLGLLQLVNLMFDVPQCLRVCGHHSLIAFLQPRVESLRVLLPSSILQSPLLSSPYPSSMGSKLTKNENETKSDHFSTISSNGVSPC